MSLSPFQYSRLMPLAWTAVTYKGAAADSFEFLTSVAGGFPAQFGRRAWLHVRGLDVGLVTGRPR
jgi:hypothetical protein